MVAIGSSIPRLAFTGLPVQMAQVGAPPREAEEERWAPCGVLGAPHTSPSMEACIDAKRELDGAAEPAEACST